MCNLAVQIMRFLGYDPQPGIVACEFADAEGRVHTLIDKVPIFSTETIDADSIYPLPGHASCEVLERWRDVRGCELVRVSTARPWGIESTEGLSEFVVLSTQLS
jgi:hypothetical protein